MGWLSTTLDFVPGVSNIKAGVEAISGKDFITGREIGYLERGALVAAIFGGPIVKGATKVVKWGGKHLSKLKNVFNPDKIKAVIDDALKAVTKGFNTLRNTAAQLSAKISNTRIPTWQPAYATPNGAPIQPTTLGEAAYGVKKQIVSMAGKVKDGVGRGVGKDNIIKEIKETEFGKHIVKGKNGKKQLLPNAKYVTNDNYKYTTDELGRIVTVEASELVLKKANRNKYAQANVGDKDRLPDDDGGHLIGAQFNGPPDIDNLVPQNSQINRRGGVWYEMETEWANALKEVPPKKVSVSIEPIYSNKTMRPNSFLVEYEIEGQFPIIREIANKSGG